MTPEQVKVVKKAHEGEQPDPRVHTGGRRHRTSCMYGWMDGGV